MPAIPFSRRRWLGASAMGCGCMLASSVDLAEGAEASRIPPSYTPPEGVTDLSKASGEPFACRRPSVRLRPVAHSV